MAAMLDSLPDLIPARILNEHVYCRRLAYLEWVDSVFAGNADTAEGSFVHRNVDRERSAPPEPPRTETTASATGAGLAAEGGVDAIDMPRSSAVTVSSERLGLIAKVDVLEALDGAVVPVEFKRGRPRQGDLPLWEPELVQLCAQVLILRDAGPFGVVSVSPGRQQPHT
jgi:CRISPR-associated protein Cas1